MNWKKLLSDFSLKFGWFLAAMVLLQWMRGSHLSYSDFVECAFLAVPFSLGSVGFSELDRGGHQRYTYLILPCVMILSILVPAVVLREGYSTDWCLAAFSLFAFPFPLALYLNRNQSRSKSQPTIENVS
jgi:hypothetical protein